jgi:hypothetical protein
LRNFATFRDSLLIEVPFSASILRLEKLYQVAPKLFIGGPTSLQGCAMREHVNLKVAAEDQIVSPEALFTIRS